MAEKEILKYEFVFDSKPIMKAVRDVKKAVRKLQKVMKQNHIKVK